MPKNKISQMRFSKFITISIVLLLCYPTFMASAASTENISIGSSVANPGDVIELPITIENATDVEKLTLNITYDKDILNVTSIKANESIQNSTITHSVDNNNGIATIELTNHNNITAISTIPLIDVTFQAKNGGISALSLQDVKLTKNSVQYPPGYVSNGELYVNSPPQLQQIGNKQINETETLEIVISATDPDNNTLTYATNATFGILEGNTFKWTPGYEQEGTYIAEFSVSDENLTDSETIIIIVNEVNRPPQLQQIGNKQINETETLEIVISATDPDNNTLTYATNATFGILEGNTFKWTSGYEEAGTYSVKFSVSDEQYIISEHIIIIVTEKNRAPDLESISGILIDESDTVTIELIAQDLDNDNIEYSKDVDFGTLSGNIFTWTTGYGDSGLHYVNFTATDGNLSDTEKVLIAVGDTNRPPVLEEIGTIYIDENSTFTFKLNASDYDGDPITYSAEGLPSGASLENSTGLFTWTPTYEQAGTYIVEFSAKDSIYKAVEQVTIEVNNVNRAPSFENILEYAINETETVTITLNASDPDNNPITYSKNVTIGSLNDNKFTWTTDYYDNGTHYIEFTATDGILSDSRTAIISVSNSNMPPEISPITKYVDENDDLEFMIEANDGDGDTLSYYGTSLPEGSELNDSTGVFTWKPAYDQEGTYSFEINVTDGNHDISETATIIVRDKEPIASEKFKNINSGSGGGGGSQSTGEKYENIEVKDYALKSVAREVKTSYEFKDEANSINYINFTALKNAGQVKAIIEVLKNQSSLVETSPSGVVYQHMNIWVGDSKFTTAGFIAYADITFEVDRSWIEDNEIAESSIRLCRHSKNGWTELPTKKIGEDEDKIYFKAKTPGFSPFAINGDKISDVIAENEKALHSTQSTSSQITTESNLEAEIQTDVVSDTEEYSEEAIDQAEKKSSGGLFILFIGIIGIAGAGGYVMKNEDKRATIMEMKMKYMEKWMKNREP